MGSKITVSDRRSGLLLFPGDDDKNVKFDFRRKLQSEKFLQINIKYFCFIEKYDIGANV